MSRYLILACVLAAPTLSLAQESPSSRASELFARGAEAFSAEHYAEAAELLEEAFELDPAPVLLYNLGRAYEADEAFEDAVDTYGRYLDLQPDAENAGEVEGRLVRLRRSLRADSAPAVDVSPERVAQGATTEPPDEARGGVARVLPWAMVGVGVGGVGVGFLMRHFALQRAESAEQAASHQEGTALVAQEEGLRRVSVGLWIGGGALALAGAVWALAKPGEGEGDVAVGPGNVRVRF